MSRVFMIADTHFGEDAIRRYENRPFSSVAEMDEKLMEKWNAEVKEEDIVYHLGDFSIAGKEKGYLDRLKGRKILVRGNHDSLSNQAYRVFGFEEVYDLPVILDGFWILSHEPIYVNENMPYANVFGHVHGSLIYQNWSRQHYCVSVERLDYCPIDFEIIKERVKSAAAAPLQ